MPVLKILLEQLNSIKGPEANKKIIEETLSKEFDIAIFPELFYSGYLWRDYIRFLDVDIDFIDRIKSAVGNRMLIFGAPVYDNFLRNSAVIIHENNISFYHKMHLPTFGPFEEERFFKKGSKPVVINFKNLKINVEICYDLFFDDPIILGSDLIINISASPFTSRQHFERIFSSVAIKNQAYLIYVNTAGLQRNLVFWGGSRIIDPDGTEVKKLNYMKEESSFVSIDTNKINISRIKRPILKEVQNESEK
ncbi:MAG: carbon-nitrogen hydrolase family protein [Thermoplasmata archaeon]